MKKDRMITIKITDEFHTALKKAAVEEKTSMSNLVRLWIGTELGYRYYGRHIRINEIKKENV